MITFEIKKQDDINISYQSIHCTEVAIQSMNQVDDKHIIDSFLQSKQFQINYIKSNSVKDYLKPALNYDKIKHTDFIKTDKTGVSKYLLDFINSPDWGEDRSDFAQLIDRYFEHINEFKNNHFYILSKDWFNKNDERLIKVDNEIYAYYFLIISLDNELNQLTLTEWIYD